MHHLPQVFKGNLGDHMRLQLPSASAAGPGKQTLNLVEARAE